MNTCSKKYSIAQDDWITNSKKFFNHGEEFFDEDKVIDADVTDKGDELIVTGGIYHDSRTLDAAYVTMPVNDYRLFFYDRHEWTTYKYLISISGYASVRQILGSKKFPNHKGTAKIFTNGKENKTIDLTPYAKDVEERALACAALIMKQSYTEADVVENDIYEDLMAVYTDIGEHYSTYEYEHVEKLVSPFVDKTFSPPDEPFIAYTTAHVMTSNIGENGFEGVIFAATYGYCFPHIRPRLTVYYTDEVGNPDRHSHYTKLYEWKCVPFGVSCLYKVEGDTTELEPVAFRDFGGIDSDVMIVKDDKAFLAHFYSGQDIDRSSIFNVRGQRHVTLLSGLAAQEFDEIIPVGEGFYRMDKFGRLTFYNSKKEIVAENIPVHDDYYHIEIEHGEYYSDGLFDTDFNNKPHLICKIYTSDGKVEESTMIIGGIALNDNKPKIYAEQGDKQSELPPIDGYYIKYPTGKFEPLQFTPLFYEFKGGSYLYGVKGGKLYHKTADDTVEQVGDGLKNFRLRELRRISKAKK